MLLIAAVAIAVLWGRGGVKGWLSDPISERLRLVGVAVQVSIRDGESIPEVLANQREAMGVTFVLVDNDGEHFGGPTIRLPEAIAERLDHGGRVRPDGPLGPLPPPERSSFGENSPPRGGPPPPRREGPPPPRGDGPRPPRGDGPGPPPGDDRFGPPQNGRPPRPTDAPPEDGRIFEYDTDTRRWWAGTRIPIWLEHSARPLPGTLFAVSESAWSFGRLLDLRPVVYTVAAVIVLSVLFWLPLVMGITRSLRQAVRATGEIAQGRFDVAVETHRRDELGALGESINLMASRLERLVNGQKKFLADIAHEIGSPLGRLQLGSAILEDRVTEDLKPAVRDVQEEIQQMSDLLGELLAFTKVSLQAREAKIQPVVLKDVVNEALRREASDLQVAIRIKSAMVVGGDAKLLLKVVSNLLRNAVRYGGEVPRIEIEARYAANGRLAVQIHDDGPGVPEDALIRLGEPFYRPDEARSRELGGTGLGLSIVRESIEAMGGRVTFANREPQGFTVTLELNVAAV